MTTDLFQSIALCAEVAVPVPVAESFTYLVPESMAATARPGVRVKIPFKNRETIGYVVSVETKEPGRRLKSLIEILDPEPVVSPMILKLTKQIASYYGCSWGEAIENALPKWVKYGKKAERALKVRDQTSSNIYPIHSGKEFLLTAEQESVMSLISDAVSGRSPKKPILIHGVTGSGKSELYIRSIRLVRALGQSAVCLVPEITLTEQLKRFFACQFGEELEVLHSKLSDGERFRAWKRIEQGESRIILGPRSAVFAPAVDLGLIIIDEEQENSYKQETVPRYHAREAARWRAANENALLIMGSATPSMEAMHSAHNGEYHLVTMAKRIDSKPLPRVMIVDLKEQVSEKKRNVILSRQLAREIELNLQRSEGTMLLLNRRGFSTHIHCPKCGHVEDCESCQVSLTYHQEEDILLCHYCNVQKKMMQQCANCREPLLRFAGFGTEKVESEVARWFPQARISRLDADTIRRKGSHEIILGEFRDRRIDILIGTQMIAKGFDFPHVTLVGVILADVGLMLPDFRSSERTFQLLTQVAGRAGRGDKPGRVIIQTFSPNHPSVKLAQTHDYSGFYRHESPERMQHAYPPFNQLINFIVRSANEKKVYLAAKNLRDTVRSELDALKLENAGIEIIGPAPLPFAKLRGHFRWHVMIKGPKELTLAPSCLKALGAFKKPSGVQIAVDVDPLNIL